MFSSDNGAETFTWPDGGMQPFKGEKGTTFEGGFRVPCLARWPGVIKPGTIVNDIMSHEDWMPTFVAAAGDPEVKTKLLTGFKAGNKTFKNHLDGYNFMSFFKGEVAEGPRHEIYFDDNGNLNALRYNAWKIEFSWIEGNLFTGRRTANNVPLVVNLRQDPFEKTPFESDMYRRWVADKLWTLVPAQAIAGQFIQSFKEFPPSQRSGSMNLDQVLSNSRQAHPEPASDAALNLQPGRRVQKVVNGYYRYHAVPGNIDRLSVFGQRLRRMWRLILRRRSKRRRSWNRVTRIFKRWIPAPRVLHPYPTARFLATHPRWEPHA